MISISVGEMIAFLLKERLTSRICATGTMGLGAALKQEEDEAKWKEDKKKDDEEKDDVGGENANNNAGKSEKKGEEKQKVDMKKEKDEGKKIAKGAKEETITRETIDEKQNRFGFQILSEEVGKFEEWLDNEKPKPKVFSRYFRILQDSFYLKM